MITNSITSFRSHFLPCYGMFSHITETTFLQELSKYIDEKIKQEWLSIEFFGVEPHVSLFFFINHVKSYCPKNNSAQA